MARQREIKITRSSGNVFADLSLPNPELEREKSSLVMMIDDAIKVRRLTQAAAGALMGIDQPKVSHLLRGGFGGFSTQRLLEFLTRLGRDVDIIVRPAKGSRGRGRLRVSMG